ncbi:ABC transporter permease [Marinigracilibium pacificum]|uniref:FtsX-like permease family protein n=1 Tax=Marinigracilibium pacificum TaxID=2729599 RepID=A0A848IUN4_9BACT|nr:FtsX-like permease family protein [Marinigracilibium pacificum]NMM46931.1 FtsX-like permease family protein [Marinigracilibium pacificum]
MNDFYISFKSVLAKPWYSLMSVLLVATGTGIISLLFLIDNDIQKKLYGDVKGVQMVVGAKGSPLQLILSAVYQADNPTGNIKAEEIKPFLKHPLVKKAIPLAYGDSYNGTRIVGTDTSYLNLYNAKLKKGTYFSKPMEVVLGAEAAATHNLTVGDIIYSQHGQAVDADKHDHPFKVTGVLAPTGLVIDRLFITRYESLWDVHEVQGQGDYTAFLFQFKNPMGQLMLSKMINTNSSMQAALPSIEIDRLMTLLGTGYETLKILAYGIICLSGFAVFVTLFTSLQQKKYDLTVMRVLGYSKRRVLFQVIIEACILCLAGILVGLLLSRIVMYFISVVKDSQWLSGSMFDIRELYLFPGVILLAIIAALIPSYKIYKTDIAEVLSDEK